MRWFRSLFDINIDPCLRPFVELLKGVGRLQPVRRLPAQTDLGKRNGNDFDGLLRVSERFAGKLPVRIALQRVGDIFNIAFNEIMAFESIHNDDLEFKKRKFERGFFGRVRVLQGAVENSVSGHFGVGHRNYSRAGGAPDSGAAG
jgi:hypothetical protein